MNPPRVAETNRFMGVGSSKAFKFFVAAQYSGASFSACLLPAITVAYWLTRMPPKGSNSPRAQAETAAVAQSHEVSSSIRAGWRWVLYATAGVAIVVAVKYFHVQDLVKAALDWIGKLGPWGP